MYSFFLCAILLSLTSAAQEDEGAQNPVVQVTIKPDDVWASFGEYSIEVGLCLDNRNYAVGGLQVDVCEEIDGNPNNCLSCIGCAVTERTVIFDCFVNELSDGCCRVMLISKHPSGIVNRGLCSIVKIDYDPSEECPLSKCIMLVPSNIKISDQNGYPLIAAGLTGSVCNFGCGDLYPPETFPGASDCGNSIVDIFDILREVDFAIGKRVADGCQASRVDVPTGTPPNCIAPDGVINIFDIMVIIDMALHRQDCCSYYYMGIIY